jgi:ppGpp synthetase/RelA/SpoT-type nucleotidyltranferase
MPPHDQSGQQIFETLQAAEDVAERLRALTGSLGPDFFSTQFYTRIRVKSYSSIVQKIFRKRWEQDPSPILSNRLSTQRGKVGDDDIEPPGEPYSFHRITDLVGFRIVTLYDDDIEHAIRHLLSFIQASSGFREALFSPFNPLPNTDLHPWDYVREAIFFRRPQVEGLRDIYEKLHDDFQTEFDERFKSDAALHKHYSSKLDLRRPLKGDYSSAHFVLNARSSIRKTAVDIPVEVQIRTASEDIWGEINHRLYYKAKDLFVWTPELEKTYNEMEYWSHATKKTLDELRGPITEFWRKSGDAENLILEFQEPDVPFHRSLIVTLLYAISKSHMGHADQKLREYDDTLRVLEQHIAAAATIDTLRKCKELMTEAQQAFRATRDHLAAKKRSDPQLSVEMLEQRILLCDIELARLDALAIVNYGHLIESDHPPRLLDEMERSKHLRLIFDAMCELRNNSKLRLRPVAMLSYWKFLISKHIDPSLAMYHLEVAASELIDDRSLPRWSIYHIHIRRSLAYELFAEAYRLVRGNGKRSSSQVWWKSHLAITVQNMLERSFKLLLESYTRQKNKDEKAGDLIFGYRSDEEMLDASMLAGITSWYLHLFGRLDCGRLGTSLAFVLARLNEVRESLDSFGEIQRVDPTGRINRINRLTRDIEILTDSAENGRQKG